MRCLINLASKDMNSITPIVKNLIIVNVLIFIGTFFLPESIKQFGSIFFYESELFRPFQIVTSMFMHGSIMHLAFNMMSLYFLGPFVEKVMGSERFLMFYLLCGLGATAAHLGINAYEYYGLIDGVSGADLLEIKEKGRSILLRNQNYSDPIMGSINRILNVGALGASGAVYGVMIAFASMFPNIKMMVFPLPVPVKAKYLAIGLIVFGIYNGFGGHQQGIAHFAHLGGAVTGFALVYFWKLINLK